jgi:hypothetical protein
VKVFKLQKRRLIPGQPSFLSMVGVQHHSRISLIETFGTFGSIMVSKEISSPSIILLIAINIDILIYPLIGLALLQKISFSLIPYLVRIT